MSAGATMRTKFSLLLLVLIATSASAASRYVSAEYGFAASFPADVVHSQILPDVSLFDASTPGSAWQAQVKVTRNVTMPQQITKDFMDSKLAEVIKSGGMVQRGDSSYITFQGHPALLATAIFFINNSNTQGVSYAVVVDIKLIFVKSQNLIKGQNRIYLVDGMAIQGKDRSGIQAFLDSFELK
jgi:hypothetical protein